MQDEKKKPEDNPSFNPLWRKGICADRYNSDLYWWQNVASWIKTEGRYCSLQHTQLPLVADSRRATSQALCPSFPDEWAKTQQQESTWELTPKCGDWPANGEIKQCVDIIDKIFEVVPQDSADMLTWQSSVVWQTLTAFSCPTCIAMCPTVCTFSKKTFWRTKFWRGSLTQHKAPSKCLNIDWFYSPSSFFFSYPSSFSPGIGSSHRTLGVWWGSEGSSGSGGFPLSAGKGRSAGQCAVPGRNFWLCLVSTLHLQG